MESFINEFKIFFNGIWGCVVLVYDWLFATTLGKCIMFVILISLFFLIINLLDDMKD